MGACLGSCIGSCAIGACCSLCSCSCLASDGLSNLVYVAIVALAAILGVSLRYGDVDLNVGFSLDIYGPSVCHGSGCSGFSYTICNADSCKGYWAVYRTAFTLASFFFIMMLLTSCRCAFASRMHRGFWFAKVAMLVLIFVGALFAPNDLFATFAWIARFVAPLFLIYQCVVMIDFGYHLNERWIKKDEENDSFCYHRLILLIAFLCYAGSLTSIGFMYARFPMSCAFNPLAITTTLLFNIINTGIAVSEIAEHGSILCSGIIFAYTTFLCYSTISALPEPECNPSAANDEVGWLIASCVVAGITLGYIAFRQGSAAIGANKFKGGESQAPAIELSTNIAHGGGGGATDAKPIANDQLTVQVDTASNASSGFTAEEAPADVSYFWYHCRMLTIAMYMAMMLTNWGVPAHTIEAGEQQYSKGYASAWLQMAVNWLCNLLYFWTLIAVKACPDRDFS